MNKIFQAQFVLSAMDNASRVINRVSSNAISQMDAISKKADKMAGKAFSFGRDAATFGAAVGGPLILATQQAMEFETAMSNVATLLQGEDIAKMGQNVLDISRRVPVAISDLTSALYDVRSAGITADQAMSVLESSAQLSAAGLSSTKEATNIMTSAMNAFKSEGLSSEQVADILFKTVKAGKTDISQLAQAFGATAPIIQATGVKLADFQAATAALTTLGTPASQAQNQLKAAMVSLQKPTETMKTIFQDLGVKSGKELVERTGSIGAAFQAIEASAKKQNIAFQDTVSSVEAYSAMVAITGATNAAYNDTLKSMTDGTNAMGEAFDKQMNTGAAGMQIMKNEAMALAITIGNNMIPILQDVWKSLRPVVERISAWVKENPELVAQIVKVAAGAAALSTAVAGLSFVFGGALKVFSFVITTIKMITMVTRIMSMTMLANPVVAIITAIAVAALLIWQYWEPIKAFFTKLWSDITDTFNTFWNWVTGFSAKFYDAGVNIIDSIWKGIKAMVNKPIEAIKEMTEEMRAYLPFSPAKKGAFRDIHRVKIVETIAQSIKPSPLIDKFKKTASATFQAVGNLIAPKTGSSVTPAISGGAGGSNFTFNPTINVYGGDANSFRQVIKEYGEDFYRMIQEYEAKQGRKKF